jgi:type I restriction enzyme, S subunit
VLQDNSDEPADALLRRILGERRAKWEAEQIAKVRAQGRMVLDDGWRAKYQEPKGPDMAGVPGLPEGWRWASVEQLSLFVTDADHNPPKRVDRGIPHLTAKNVVGWRLSERESTCISKEDFERARKRYDPQENDVIVTCVGTIGRTAIVPRNYVFSADRNLAAIRLIPTGIDPKFLQFNLNTPQAQQRIQGASGSTAQAHFYLADIRAFPIVVAPFAEQQRIIAEVERRLSVVDEVEAAVAANLKRAVRLRQAILKRAFKGKLVPQDPSGELASMLLERIRREREGQGGKKGVRQVRMEI